MDNENNTHITFDLDNPVDRCILGLAVGTWDDTETFVRIDWAMNVGQELLENSTGRHDIRTEEIDGEAALEAVEARVREIAARGHLV